VIAATNQDLEDASLEGKFRKDLFYRLNVCPVYIPPLRERKDDITTLAKHFISEYNLKFRKNIKGLRKDAQTLFLEYEWPGNVRELKNALERAMIFEDDSFISSQYLPIRVNGDSAFQKRSPKELSGSSLSLQGMEKKLLTKALKQSNGNKTQAARLLNITRDTLRYKMKKLNIKPEEYGLTKKAASSFAD
jgi:transcriptional regulator with PAS, ATPase and Fis domain